MVGQTNEVILPLVKKLIRKIKGDYKVSEAILFGSRARGDHMLTSDVDVLFISDDFEGKRISDRMADVMFEWSGEVDLEPLCYTTDEFEMRKQKMGIVAEAVREGIIL
ncbi:MAG: putative nucleotidyltransferase [Patescibacteria group bacterium]|jgi:predicted nucleotidyltransferase